MRKSFYPVVWLFLSTALVACGTTGAKWDDEALMNVAPEEIREYEAGLRCPLDEEDIKLAIQWGEDNRFFLGDEIMVRGQKQKPCVEAMMATYSAYGNRRDGFFELDNNIHNLLNNEGDVALIRTNFYDLAIYAAECKRLYKELDPRMVQDLANRQFFEVLFSRPVLGYGFSKGIDGRYSRNINWVFMPHRVVIEQNGKIIKPIPRRYTGVGIGLDAEEKKVTEVLDGAPASKAGIKPGDKITKMDRETTEDLTYNDIVEKMRGPK